MSKCDNGYSRVAYIYVLWLRLFFFFLFINFKINIMLKTNELRIGNHIIYAGKKIIVEGIVKNTIYHSNGQFDQNIEPAYEPFEPIPITIELLLNFGFKKCKKYSTFCYPEYRKKIRNSWNSYICFIFADNWELPYCCDIKELPSTIYDIKEKHGSFGIQGLKVNYIHQVQNLFFSLCGKELVFSSTEP